MKTVKTLVLGLVSAAFILGPFTLQSAHADSAAMKLFAKNVGNFQGELKRGYTKETEKNCSIGVYESESDGEASFYISMEWEGRRQTSYATHGSGQANHFDKSWFASYVSAESPGGPTSGFNSWSGSSETRVWFEDGVITGFTIKGDGDDVSCVLDN